MNSRILLYCLEFASVIPYLAIVAILIYYFLSRWAWKRRKRQGKSAGFCPSASALGAVLLFAQIFYRPSVSWLIEARLVERVEDDDDGEPETPLNISAANFAAFATANQSIRWFCGSERLCEGSLASRLQ